MTSDKDANRESIFTSNIRSCLNRPSRRRRQSLKSNTQTCNSNRVEDLTLGDNVSKDKCWCRSAFRLRFNLRKLENVERMCEHCLTGSSSWPSFLICIHIDWKWPDSILQSASENSFIEIMKKRKDFLSVDYSIREDRNGTYLTGKKIYCILSFDIP